MLNKQSPIISVAEAIHGNYNTNFELGGPVHDRGGLPLGRINEGKVVEKAIFARETSRNSIQYLHDDVQSDNNDDFLFNLLNQLGRGDRMPKIRNLKANKTIDPKATNFEATLGGSLNQRQTQSILKM